jgi:dipicolinate synthase subunit B
MEYYVKINKRSADARVKELGELFEGKQYNVLDFGENADDADKTKKAVYFFEPRFNITCDIFAGAMAGSIAFGYAKELPECAKVAGIKYLCLSDDEEFIKENNRLTAEAVKQIIQKNTELNTVQKQKILLIGWGKLTNAIEKIFTDADLHILNFNVHKVPELRTKYGEKAYFETAPFHKFPIIINTIPKEMLKPAKWQKRKKQIIYELASPPYGFDWAGVKKNEFNYQIEPALPGRYFPKEAGQAVFDCIQKHLAAAEKPTIVFCITGSACSYLKLLPILEDVVTEYEVIPVLSENANRPNRFCNIDEFKEDIRKITGHNLVTNIAGAEVMSANKKIKCSVVFPATGNTIAKLTHAITDTCVLMAAKALLRNGKPCVVGISTNDALSGNAKNIGELLNRKNYYFVPFGQDDIINKPFSMICDFTKVKDTIKSALNGTQIQPILLK